MLLRLRKNCAFYRSIHYKYRKIHDPTNRVYECDLWICTIVRFVSVNIYVNGYMKNSLACRTNEPYIFVKMKNNTFSVNVGLVGYFPLNFKVTRISYTTYVFDF